MCVNGSTDERANQTIKFNRFKTCSLESEIENKLNRLEIMQVEAEQYTFYLRSLQETDEEAYEFLRLCDQRK